MNLLTLVFLLYLNESGQPVDKCLTGKIIEEFQKTGKISVPAPILSKKADYYTTHFVIHYDPTQVSTAYVESTAKYFEYSWEIEVDTLGWDAPPIDPNVGYYEVTLSDLSGGVLGYTSPYAPGPDPNQEDYYSYIVVDINLPYSTLKATVSHEFNHACQFSYTAFDAVWFYENCATWMEDLVYDDINDYIGYLQYANNPLNFPDSAITTFSNGLYQYAGCLFPMFLSEWLNTPDVVRDIWAQMGINSGEHTLSDINYVLQNSYGTSLDTALFYYGEWRYFTGSNDDGWHFEEASLWPSPYILNQHYSYPASGDNTSRKIGEPGGTHFIKFRFLGGKSLIVNFDGMGLRVWNVRLINRGGTPPYSFEDMNINQTTGDGVDTTSGGVAEVVMVVTDAKYSGFLREDVTFIYSADRTTNVSENSYVSSSELKVIPVSDSKYLILSGFSGLVYVFNSAGRKINSYRIKKGRNLLNIPVGISFLIFKNRNLKNYKVISLK